MKHILFVGMCANKGGIETFIKNVFLKLEGHGFQFDFINMGKDKLAYSSTILKYGGVIRHVYIPYGIKGRFVRDIKIKDFFSKFKGYYDIVHINSLTINDLCWIKIARKYGVKTLIIQSHISNFMHRSGLIRRDISNLLAYCNRLYLKRHKDIIELAVSDDAGRWMFKNNRYIVTSNGVDTFKFRYNKNNDILLRKKFHFNKNDKIVISVARLSYQKNYNKIIKVFNLLRNLDKNIKLIIVGDGPEKKKIINMVNHFHLNDSVFFLGIINDVYNVLNMANLMLMPSHYEGLPFSLIEAQSSGVPALVSSDAISKDADITSKVRYISLRKSDLYWAKHADSMLKSSPNAIQRYRMNNIVRNSKYNLDNSIKDIEEIYQQ